MTITRDNWNSLYTMYWVEALSFKEMGQRTGIQASSLRRWYLSWGFKTRPKGPVGGHTRGITDVQLQNLLRDLEIGKLSQAAIAKKYKLSKQRISQIVNGDRRSV